MHKTTSILRGLTVVAAVLLTLSLSGTSRADDHLDVLRVGANSYTNVTVLNKTPTDIFFKHSHGFGNTKVREVDRATLLALGYQLPPDESQKPSVFSHSAQTVMESSAVTNLVADPRVQEAQALVMARLDEWTEKLTPQVMYRIVGGVIAIYLLFSFCCRQICVKTNQRPSPLIWLPLLKQFPLLRAANMSPWWFLFGILLLPIGWPLMQIVWAFKIGPARGKSWVIGLFLLLPITNVLAFLYLAFSGNGEGQHTSNVISLGPPPARKVA
jgi:hypothetical protein